MSDVLAKLDPPKLAAFYRRLAAKVDANKGKLKVSLAALLLNHWLDNRDPNSTFELDAPEHLKNHSSMEDGFLYHRAVYLTEQQARLGGGVRKWAGILPRLQGKEGFAKWDGSYPLSLDYQSLVEIALWLQVSGNDADRDLLYALHGFQLKTYVSIAAAKIPGSTKLRVQFKTFKAQVLDTYNWDYTEHLTVPNPDYGSKAADAIEPDSKTIVVYHKNAERLEKAKLAAPYKLQTTAWDVSKPDILLSKVDIDPNRRY